MHPSLPSGLSLGRRYPVVVIPPVREVYGAGKTQCIALLAAFFALRGHQVYYAARENTTIVAMATFVHQLLPRASGNGRPGAIRLLSQPQACRNPNVWHAKLVLATTGLHLAQFRHKHRPLAKAVDYAELFIYDEAQQEAALSDLAILGPSDLGRQVRLISDQLALGIRAPCRPYLPQALPALLQTLLLDDLPPDALPPTEEDADTSGAPTQWWQTCGCSALVC